MIETLEWVGVIVCAIIVLAIVNPYKSRFYFERTLMFFGFCPKCKKFSINHIKGYPVCSGCGKR